MNLKRGIKILQLIFREPTNRKPALPLVMDLMQWIRLNRGGAIYFYLYKLHRRGMKVRDFLTTREYNKVHDRLDPKYYRPMLEDKILFDRYIKSFGVPSPEMLGIINQGRVLWLDENRYDDLDSIPKRKLNAYCKLVTSWGGKSIYKIDTSGGSLLLNNKPADPAELKGCLKRGKYILQQTIGQHELLNRLNPSCVNTVRVYTIMDGNRPVFYRSAFRMGVGGSIVDNVSSNNLATGITPDHFLMEEAHSGTNPPRWYKQHPDTGVVFGEFRVPFIEEAHDLCCKTHQYFGDFFFIAWDVAITADGPMILEGNPAADLFGLQVLYGGQKSRFLHYAEKFSGMIQEARS